MKHLLLIFLLLPLFFVSCGTEDNATPSTAPADLIKGTWDSQTRKIEYFNGSGTKLYEETEPNGPGTFTFDGTKMHVASASGDVQEIQFYKVTTTSSKTILSISRNGTIYNDMDLSRLTKTNMTWVIEKTHTTPVTYTENGVDKLAQKSKQTYELTR